MSIFLKIAIAKYIEINSERIVRIIKNYLRKSY